MVLNMQQNISSDKHHLDSYAITILERANISTPENRDAVAAHANPRDLASALESLNENDILTPKNRDAVAAHPNPFRFANTLVDLQEADILTSEHRDALARHDNPMYLASALILLHQAGILTPDNLEAVATHDKPQQVSIAFCSLYQADIFTAENRGAVTRHPYLSGFACALNYLQEANHLTQEHFLVLIDPLYQALLAPTMRGVLWERLAPVHLRDNWERILVAARNANPIAALTALTVQILEFEANRLNPQINTPQSTHTASVHQSISESAVRLMSRYGSKMSLDVVCKEILALPEGLQKSAAKRAITRLTRSGYEFTDPQSGVSIKQLLALVYIAIHDNKPKEDGVSSLFVTALYEIQRGYNLSATDIDDEAPDNPICPAGAFNKLIEKLQGIHPDCEVLVITKQLASLKLPVVVREVTLQYLVTQANTETRQQALEFTSLMNQLELDGIAVVWPIINDEVANRMFEEFGCLYQDKDDLSFTAFIDSGECVSFGRSSALQEQFTQSEGYRQYLDYFLRPSLRFFGSACEHETFVSSLLSPGYLNYP